MKWHNQLLIFFFCSATLVSAQVSNCPYTKSINGIQLQTTHEAESNLISGATHPIGSNINYGAPEVELRSNFMIDATTSLQVSNEGCQAICLPDDNPCEDDCPSAHDTEENERGNRYIRHEVVLTFPEDAVVTYNNQDYEVQVNGTSFVMHSILSEFITGPLQGGTLRRCMCDDNIFFYRNESMIFDEGGMVRTNRAAGGVKEEGGVFSLNYIIDYAETPFNSERFVFSTNVAIKNRAYQDRTGSETIVAILDSGINPEMMPENSLYYVPVPSTFVCGLVDPEGYNFVEDNVDLLDNRGHGTLVSLAYLKAYQDLIPSEEMIIKQKLLTVKILDGCGEGTLYTALCGLKYAVAKGASVINCSWGLYQPDRNLQRVIEEINKLGTVQIVCSSGNRAKELSEDAHFPSGFAHEYFRYIDEEQEEIAGPLDFVWEVSGSCRYLTDECGDQRENLPLAETSNYRNGYNFAEPSKGVEKLLPEDFRPDCQIQGTSYAAPVMAGGLAFLQVTGDGISENYKVLEYCRKIHPDEANYSFLLQNCNQD